MKKQELSEILSGIDEKYIKEADLYVIENKRSTEKTIGAYIILWRSLAAGFIALVIAGAVLFGVEKEKKEYKEAMLFFEENSLSADGLSQADVKKIYKDITSNSFTYEKTAEVIKKNVAGVEIRMDELTPEEIAILWANRNNNNDIPENDINNSESLKNVAAYTDMDAEDERYAYLFSSTILEGEKSAFASITYSEKEGAEDESTTAIVNSTFYYIDENMDLINSKTKNKTCSNSDIVVSFTIGNQNYRIYRIYSEHTFKYGTLTTKSVLDNSI